MRLFTKKKHTAKGLAGVFLGCSLATWLIFLTGLPVEVWGTGYNYWRGAIAQPILGRPHWVEMPKTPFIEVGRTAEGTIDISRLLLAYRQAGLTPAQANDLIVGLRPLAPVLMGVDDPAFERELIAQAHQANQDLKTRNSRAWHILDAMARQTTGRAQGARTMPPEGWENDARWLGAFFTWKLMPSYADPTSHMTAQPGDPSLAQAKATLERAVSQTGLRALHVPVETWVSPGVVQSLGENLLRANTALQEQTGWHGGVLGLGGRVELTIAEPMSHNANGITEGTMRRRINIVSVLPSIMHEWFHALDYALPESVLQAPVGAMTLTAQAGPLRRVRNPMAYHAWRGLTEQMETLAPDWMDERDRRALETRSVYWIMDQEARAFAFQAQTGVDWLAAGPFESRIDPDAQAAWIGMNDRERAKLSTIWRPIFDTLAPLGLSGSGRGIPSPKPAAAGMIAIRGEGVAP